MISALERYGIRTYNKDIKGHVGSSEGEARGPGDKYQVDATIGDVYLVSASDPTKVIGRPVIYSVADVFSCIFSAIHSSHLRMNTFDVCYMSCLPLHGCFSSHLCC